MSIAITLAGIVGVFGSAKVLNDDKSKVREYSQLVTPRYHEVQRKISKLETIPAIEFSEFSSKSADPDLLRHYKELIKERDTYTSDVANLHKHEADVPRGYIGIALGAYVVLCGFMKTFKLGEEPWSAM